MEPTERHHQAARALGRGEPLAALNAVAGDGSPHGRALRGIALAQLEELESAARELDAAARAFADAPLGFVDAPPGFVDAPLYRARALAALAEVAAARRELGGALERLTGAARALEALGDARNAAWTRLVRARLLLLTGATAEARAELARAADGVRDDPVLAAARELAAAATATRELRAEDALAALDRALDTLGRAEHPLLAAELRAHRDALFVPLAAVTVGDTESPATLRELALLFRGGAPLPFMAGAPTGWLVVDAIARRVLLCGEDAVDLAPRPILFALLAELARAWPHAATTDELIARVFAGPPGDESHRDRLRVELGRLRRALPAGVAIAALGNAWQLTVAGGAPVVTVRLLTADSALTALLADGRPWAARDLALAIGASARTVQRALAELAHSGEVAAVGEARARRWLARREHAPLAEGIATQMFLVSLCSPADAPGERTRPPLTEERS